MAETFLANLHDGPPLFQMAEKTDMPPDHFPVGFELHRLHPDPDGTIQFTIIAVRCDEVGNNTEKIINWANAHDEVPVYRFRGRLNMEEFASFFKRTTVKVLNRNLDQDKIRVRDMMEEEIRVRAYSKWADAGKPEVNGITFWLQAEQELRAYRQAA